jgi:ferredoxin
VRIVVDRERCVGAGLCVLTSPDTFDQSEEDGRVVFLDADPTDAEQERRVRQVARLCPSGAISVTEEETVS